MPLDLHLLYSITLLRQGLVKASWLLWRPGFSDHAALMNCLEISAHVSMRKGKTKWIPNVTLDVEEVLRTCPFYKTCTWQEMSERILKLQNSLQDAKPCKLRSAERVPQEVRELDAKTALAPPAEKRACRRRADQLQRSYN